MTKRNRRDEFQNLGQDDSLGEKFQSEVTPDNQSEKAQGGHDTQEEREPFRRPPGICICPSCGRTEAQLPTSPCPEMMCPQCRVPMRKA